MEKPSRYQAGKHLANVWARLVKWDSQSHEENDHHLNFQVLVVRFFFLTPCRVVSSEAVTGVDG